MMWYLDTPVMLMKGNPAIIVFCDHPHVLWLYISGEQKVQFAVNGGGTDAENAPVFPHFPEVPEILRLPVIHGISFPAFLV